jgi:CubicO group peptidase (beta-lactamase class C family)
MQRHNRYFPPKSGDWETIVPAEAGFSDDGVEAVIAFARDNESKMDRDIGRALDTGHFSEPMPDGEIIGPTRPRGDPSGMILKGGRIVAEWGPTGSADMTFSCTKSYLSICAGLAVGDGLIPDVNQPVRELVKDGNFDSDQNRDITWKHLLQQTSEWEGTLWDKEDRIDRHRRLDLPPNTPSLKGTHRDLKAPGEFWEYNDVRVNVAALALMRVFGKPLPRVLKERVMDPIGASDDWEWHGYRNSYVEIGGEKMQSVSGGAHWGGGMFIPTRDHARAGLLMLNRGHWGDEQLVPEAWVDACTTPCELNPSYGYMWWLNGDGVHCPAAPRTSYFALGVGRNIIWIDPDLDLVAVVRWLERDAFNGFAKTVMDAMD